MWTLPLFLLKFVVFMTRHYNLLVVFSCPSPMVWVVTWRRVNEFSSHTHLNDEQWTACVVFISGWLSVEPSPKIHIVIFRIAVGLSISFISCERFTRHTFHSKLCGCCRMLLVLAWKVENVCCHFRLTPSGHNILLIDHFDVCVRVSALTFSWQCTIIHQYCK